MEIDKIVLTKQDEDSCKVDVATIVICPLCRGTGLIPSFIVFTEVCPRCNGKGSFIS